MNKELYERGDRIRRQLAERLPTDAPLVDRVRQLAVIQDEQGYLCHASVSADGSLLLQEHNCAIFHVAKGNPAACQAELDLFLARGTLLDSRKIVDIFQEALITAPERSATTLECFVLDPFCNDSHDRIDDCRVDGAN